MRILALHNPANHDSGAAIFCDEGGELRFVSISDERLSRVKYSYFFPLRAIGYCMAEFGIRSLRDFDVIACDYSFERRLLNTNLVYRKLEADYIKTKLDLDYSRLLYVDHHAAHAASAFYPSGFEDAAVLVVDGLGSEGNTNSLYVGTKTGGLQPIEKAFGMGIGRLYTLVTRRILGFGIGEEGKTMGLGALGEQFQGHPSILDLNPRYDGLVTDFSAFMWRTPSAALRQPFSPCVDRTQVTNPYYARIAFEVQAETERCMLHLARYAFERTGKKRLCIAGGVALNCVANERIVDEGPFEDVFIQPAASDTGIPLGLGLWAYHEHKKGTRAFYFRTAFTGRTYDLQQTTTLLERVGIPYESAEVNEVARLLSQKAIVGWFVGSSELGPRALGHRSILADPRSADMKDTLNAKVKHREMFRPFAPSVLEERALDYFLMKGSSPFMLRAPMVRPDKVDVIPAVVHLDRSARVHTVSEGDNPRFYELIADFEALTGVPVLINTSFNDNGEPIVETPLDALICFLRTGLDHLFIDGLLVSKGDIKDAPELLSRLLAERGGALKAAYHETLRQLCPDYSMDELKAFLKAYHPMHEYYGRMHTLVSLQRVLGAWHGGPVYVDAYHLDLICRFLPEEGARLRGHFVVVQDTHETTKELRDGSLVILFNASLYVRDRALTNFYDDLSMPILRPPFEHEHRDSDLSSSNEFVSSNDWDAFYSRLLSAKGSES